MRARTFFSLLIAALLVLGICEGQVWGQVVVNVNCSKHETITQALQGFEGSPITIQVKGTCNENVDIARDDVTLLGANPSATVNGPDSNKSTIAVRGARTVIDGLTVTGGRHGINVSGNGGATIRNCTVKNTGFNGILFYRGSHGTVDNCTVQNNANHGICIEGAIATVINSTISSNRNQGVYARLSASARIGYSDSGQYAGNTIIDNQLLGIQISDSSSALIYGNTIARNGSVGIRVMSSSARLIGYNRVTEHSRGVEAVDSSLVVIGDSGWGLPSTGDFANVITGNVDGIVGNRGSSLRIESVKVDNNNGNGVTLGLRSTAVMSGMSGEVYIRNNTRNGILLMQGAGVSLQNPVVTVTGNTLFGLQCYDDESSYDGNTSGILGNGTDGLQNVSETCTGF